MKRFPTWPMAGLLLSLCMAPEAALSDQQQIEALKQRKQQLQSETEQLQSTHAETRERLERLKQRISELQALNQQIDHQVMQVHDSLRDQSSGR